MLNETRQDTFTIETTVEARFSDTLFKVNRHGTKIVEVHISYYESTKKGGLTCLVAKCGLMKNQKGINWYFPDGCPKLVVKTVLDMFIYQEIEDYIEGFIV